MAGARESIHGEWSSRWIFVLAAAGSAVGLGNIWRFPYLAGEYGGGAFVIVYLLAVAIVGLPVMIGEIMLGRRGRRSPINTMRALAAEENRSRLWQLLGWMGVVAGFLIISFYSVIGGWTVAYVFRVLSGEFSGIATDAAGEAFDGFIGDAGRLVLWHTVFLVMTMVVVARGVRGGLEQAVKYMVPALFILLLLLVVYAMASGAFLRGLEFLFAPDFSRISGTAVLAALGQAFFSLSLGMGAIMAYGSYLPQRAAIARSAVEVALADTAVALLAALAIFPIIFANALDASQQSVGLAFISLPLAFGHMTGGIVFGTVFFVLLVFAAWTSAISIVEPVVAYLVETRGWRRPTVALWVGIAIWVLGLGTVFSFNAWSEITLFGLTFFETIDFLTSNIMLPLGGLLIAIFAAWIMRRESSAMELQMSDGAYRAWRVVTRYVTPLALLLVLLQVSGVLGLFGG